MASLTRSDVEIANRGADEFLRVYYTTYDSARTEMSNFYRETSCLTWNGTVVTGTEAIKELLQRLPITKHEVQSYDCHPIATTSPPALSITVSGLVTHGQGGSSGGGETKTVPLGRNVDAQPRVFSQTFLLMKQEKYYVAADHFRFVG